MDSNYNGRGGSGTPFAARSPEPASRASPRQALPIAERIRGEGRANPPPARGTGLSSRPPSYRQSPAGTTRRRKGYMISVQSHVSTDMGSLLIGALGAAFIPVGVLNFWRQSRAGRCPVHSRRAGRVALAVGRLSLIAGIAAVTAGMLVYRGNRQLERQQMARFLAGVSAAFKGWIGIEEPVPYKQAPPTRNTSSTA